MISGDALSAVAVGAMNEATPTHQAVVLAATQPVPLPLKRTGQIWGETFRQKMRSSSSLQILTEA